MTMVSLMSIFLNVEKNIQISQGDGSPVTPMALERPWTIVPSRLFAFNPAWFFFLFLTSTAKMKCFVVVVSAYVVGCVYIIFFFFHQDQIIFFFHGGMIEKNKKKVREKRKISFLFLPLLFVQSFPLEMVFRDLSSESSVSSLFFFFLLLIWSYKD